MGEHSIREAGRGGGGEYGLQGEISDSLFREKSEADKSRGLQLLEK
jgi:hypothetical protein